MRGFLRYMKSLEDQRLSKEDLSGTIVETKQEGEDSQFATLNPIKSLLYLLPSCSTQGRPFCTVAISNTMNSCVL
jgi:hypothetical protein